tara:strand:- start:2162 stop:2779 length:618 start_codon:yes stop_codon:yes gene_type:complete
MPGSYSQFGQDVKVLDHHNHKVGGYYVEIGVHDGKRNSNTYILDKEYQWDGLCVDPFMKNMEERTCIQANVALGSEPGDSVPFVGLGKGLGGIKSFATSENHNNMHHHKTREFDETSVVVRTPQSVLLEACTPTTIDYLSLDVEGAEMDILKSFPHDTYCVALWSIETNNDKGKEREMEEFMASKGYTFEGHDKAVDHMFSKKCS